MSAITTHVLDVARGRPAEGVPIVLEIREGKGYRELGRGDTDADGRLRTLMNAEQKLVKGVYRITFDTSVYFASVSTAAFYPEASVVFEVTAPEQHYHVPLLLSPFGYSTYRGS